MQIRKAYKKCSLRFHPDKAITHCKFAACLGPTGAVLADCLDIETRVREEANWLFKCISEANVVLSDQRKRLELNSALDFEERRMFYSNELHTPPGGSYSFRKTQAASAKPRPSAYARPSANTRSAPSALSNQSQVANVNVAGQTTNMLPSPADHIAHNASVAQAPQRWQHAVCSGSLNVCMSLFELLCWVPMFVKQL